MPDSTMRRDEAVAVHGASGNDLSDLMARAATLRDRQWGNVITYSRKVFVPLTNMCRNTCKYCTFVKHPPNAAANYMTPEEVLAVARKGERAGCKEALFSLGEKPELRYLEARDALAALGYASTIDYLEAMCRLVFEETGLIPHANAGAISEEELRQLRPVSGSMGMMLETTSLRLLRPGKAHYACPDKAPKMRLRTLAAAGRNKIPFTTGILTGIGETWTERVDSLFAIANLHKQYGHIQEVIVQNFRAKPGTASEKWPEPDLNDMLRTLAVARLILPGEISLQAPPNLTDAPTHYIAAGINDWGGISPVTLDFINPERPWPMIDKLGEAVALLGYELKERLTVYPRYLHDEFGFVDPRVLAQVTAMVREDGLALHR